MEPKLTTRILKYLLIASVGISFAVALIWIALQGYAFAWTGFGDFTKPNSDFVRGKTLWDWIQLFIIPIFLSVGVFMLNRSERKSESQRAEERSKLEREIAIDRQREAALQSYLDRIADLLLKDKLRTTGNEEAQDVARIRTLTLLRGMDAKRKKLVLLFLQEAGLIENTPIINTSFISITGVYNPPHGTTFSFWDGYNIEQDQFVGGFALFNDNEVLFLPIDLRDPSLKYISKERFQRYFRPPFLRDKCYTGNRIGCVWVDIDIANFNQVLQWLDYLTQITLGILSGLIGNKIMRWQIKKNGLSQKAAG